MTTRSSVRNSRPRVPAKPDAGEHQGSSRGVGSNPHEPNLGAGQSGAPHESTEPEAPEGTGDERSKPLEPRDKR